jgi:hypothetical protein
MSTKEQIFAPKYGKGIDDFKQLIGSDYTVSRSAANRKKFILTKVADSTEAYFKFKGPIGKMYEAYESLGREKFLEKFGIADVGPRSKKVVAEHREKKAEIKEYKKSRRQEKEERKTNQELIEQLEKEKADVVVKLMNFDLVKGSPEHITLREQLADYRERLSQIPGYMTTEDRIKNYSQSDLADFQKEGEQKKTERRKNRKAKLNGNVKGKK